MVSQLTGAQYSLHIEERRAIRVRQILGIFQHVSPVPVEIRARRVQSVCERKYCKVIYKHTHTIRPALGRTWLSFIK